MYPQFEGFKIDGTNLKASNKQTQKAKSSIRNPLGIACVYVSV
jgi:hypothetical protein